MATRRNVLAGLAATTAVAALPGHAAPAPRNAEASCGARRSRRTRRGRERQLRQLAARARAETVYKEPSGDACDSYHRYEQDFAIAQVDRPELLSLRDRMGADRAGAGELSQAALDHYVKVLASCRAHGLLPILSYNHFTVPRWFAMRGGWEAGRTARTCSRAIASGPPRALGDQIGMAAPFNEANIQLLDQGAEKRPRRRNTVRSGPR